MGKQTREYGLVYNGHRPDKVKDFGILLISAAKLMLRSQERLAGLNFGWIVAIVLIPELHPTLCALWSLFHAGKVVQASTAKHEIPVAHNHWCSPQKHCQRAW